MANKETIISEYYDLAIKYKGLAEASMKELDNCKQEIMQMKAEIMNRSQTGQYLWDSNRIIISAPEIIIGNVNMNGELTGNGKVTIRSRDINMDGVSGNIVMRAPVIEQRAVDPGYDGIREVVTDTSEITSQARNICLSTQKPQTVGDKGGVFLSPKSDEGITLTSDTTISLNGTKEMDAKKNFITAEIGNLTTKQQTQEASINDYKNQLNTVKERIEKNVKRDHDLANENDLTKTNILALDELQSKQGKDVDLFLRSMKNLVERISLLAEVNRQKACLEKELAELNKVIPENFEKNPTGTSVNINSENINLKSEDGDGHVRTNPGAGILLRGNNIKLESKDETGALTPDTAKGRVSVSSRNIELSTADFKNPHYGPDQKLTSAEYPAVGNVTIRSKTVDIESMNYKYTKDQANKETYVEELIQDGSINIRSKKVKVKTVDEKGKSVGKFYVNSKYITMKATDINDGNYSAVKQLDDQGNYTHPKKGRGPNNESNSKVTEGSTMLLLAKTMSVGFNDDKKKANKVLVDSIEKLGLSSEKEVQIAVTKENSKESESIELLGGENKGINVLATNALVLQGKPTTIKGLGDKGTTLEGKVEVTGAVVFRSDFKVEGKASLPGVDTGQVKQGKEAQEKNQMDIKQLKNEITGEIKQGEGKQGEGKEGK